MTHTPHTGTPPRPPVPAAVNDFLKKITPKKDAPLNELRDRFSEAQRHDATLYTAIPNNYPVGSIEYMIEFRIRQWMKQKEIEDARLRAMAEEEKNKHKIGGNNIAPPKR